MSTNENVRLLTVLVNVTAGVAGAVANRFCLIDSAGTEPSVVKTHVPGANGAAAQGILAMKPDAAGRVNGLVACSMAIPGGKVPLELGQAVAQGDPIRIGGNSTEVDGAGYKADATGDVIVAYATKAGAVGEVIPVLFTGYSGVVA